MKKPDKGDREGAARGPVPKGSEGRIGSGKPEEEKTETEAKGGVRPATVGSQRNRGKTRGKLPKHTGEGREEKHRGNRQLQTWRSKKYDRGEGGGKGH